MDYFSVCYENSDSKNFKLYFIIILLIGIDNIKYKGNEGF